MKIAKYLNPVYWLAFTSAILFKVRMGSFYAPFRQVRYRDKNATPLFI
ncbi:MAG: hypothetical protein ACYCZO_10605 [Daejeonella sp.]